ncbi:MAG: exodeoxyribonuclease V gamma subunit [Alteromonadaceae bacterium]|jgi:exodeoxyribonuclease V gamma subunit
MENLLVLLDKIQQISPLPVFAHEVVIVQNAGMQHWLNLSLAEQRGISMNIRYALPSQFLWKLIRTLASDEDVPEQSPYSREVLTWRIYQLLASELVINDEDFSQATRYWYGADAATATISENASDSDTYTDNTSNNITGDANLKRYQLSCQLADLYEQYLIFRPQWVDAWQQGKNFESSDKSTDECNGANEYVQEIAKWQGKLWYLLTQQQPYNPVTLIEQAVSNLAEKSSILPKRISFFGINVMAPIWLAFIDKISAYTDVHFFHLNPCYAYWGDILSEKQAIKSIKNWIDGHDDIARSVGNPLLANLGQQGREFMALLHNYSTINIDVFELAIDDNIQGDEKPSILTQVQHDILTLSDARTQPQTLVDDSIVITSCHSALREVQGLHDWLLHQFNDDPSLTPKDVLVMCPQIEQYAPYVNAVFTRGWQDIDAKLPPLPCSIADRVSKDSEPFVAAFADLLNLPDSRFQVSQLISLLRLPAIQAKFAISIEEIDKVSVWLEQASIHWGLDKQHKQQVLKTDTASDNFTWQQGLAKLLNGFAFGDQSVIYNEQLLLPTVEGSDGLLLGKLMLIIEQLQNYARSLSTARTVKNWQIFLCSLLEELFIVDNDPGFIIVSQAIESMVEYCAHAEFNDEIELMLVRDFLDHHFSQPDPGRQFIVGQVTFCSMLPMRSIPFKVIAVLGLNDGEFPRQRQPLGFDLMSITPVKIGDRSRRGDDRYLFLEAIISARQSLYLSFQGRNIKNNADKQASLVLKELMEYLQKGYGWKLTESGDCGDLRQLAMQAFSRKNYVGRYPSFDKNWLALAQEYQHENQLTSQHKSEQESKTLVISAEQNEDTVLEISLTQLISFFQHPSKTFAQQQLNLYFEQRDIELDDIEPFEHNRLQSYLLRQQLLADYLTVTQSDEIGAPEQPILSARINNTLRAAGLSGCFPEAPTTSDDFEKWRADSESFSQALIINNADNPTEVNCSITITMPSPSVVDDGTDIKSAITGAITGAVTGAVTGAKPLVNHMVIHAKLPVKDHKLVFYRSSSAKAKDFLMLYFHQLFIQIWQSQNSDPVAANSVDFAQHAQLQQVDACHGFYFDTKKQKVTQYRHGVITDKVSDVKTQLVDFITMFLLGQQQALLVNAELAEQYLKAKAFEQADFEKYWADPNAVMSLGDDPYMHYFWPECPQFEHIQADLTALYENMVNSREFIK